MKNHPATVAMNHPANEQRGTQTMTMDQWLSVLVSSDRDVMAELLPPGWKWEGEKSVATSEYGKTFSLEKDHTSARSVIRLMAWEEWSKMSGLTMEWMIEVAWLWVAAHRALRKMPEGWK